MSWGAYSPLLPASPTGGAGTDALAAESIASGEPVTGAPALGQVHALAAAGIAAGTPVCGAPGLAGPEAERTGGAGAFTPAEIAAHKARQRRFLASLPAAKLSPDEAMLLARLIAEMRNLQSLPPAGREPEIAEELGKAVEDKLKTAPKPKKGKRREKAFVAVKGPEAESLAADIEELRALIADVTRAREEAEEDDLEALLLLAA